MIGWSLEGCEDSQSTAYILVEAKRQLTASNDLSENSTLEMRHEITVAG